MRHLYLTCKYHSNLRWNCKSVAFTPGYGYNGARHIFFLGAKDKTLLEHPDAWVEECKCSPTDLEIAPEDPWFGMSDHMTKTKLITCSTHSLLMLYDYSQDDGGWAIASAVSEISKGSYPYERDERDEVTQGEIA